MSEGASFCGFFVGFRDSSLKQKRLNTKDNDEKYDIDLGFFSFAVISSHLFSFFIPNRDTPQITQENRWRVSIYHGKKSLRVKETKNVDTFYHNFKFTLGINFFSRRIYIFIVERSHFC